MRRRHVLIALVALPVVLELAAHGSDEAGIAAIIFKRLAYLDLDPRGVRQFAHDYAARHLMSAGKLRAVAAAGALYSQLPQAWEDFLTRDIAHGEERITTTFLLSSDFFRGRKGAADGERHRVHYLGFFDPLQGGNPFARLRVQTGSSSGTIGVAS